MNFNGPNRNWGVTERRSRAALAGWACLVLLLFAALAILIAVLCALVGQISAIEESTSTITMQLENHTAIVHEIAGKQGICLDGEGAQCTDPALVNGTGLCLDCRCEGEPLGHCTGLSPPIDFYPEDCRNLTYSEIVETDNLFTIKYCYLDLCLYMLGPEDAGLWSCVGDDSGHYELKKDMAKHCLDYVYHDPDRYLLQSTAFCVTDLPVCVFSYKRAGYRLVREFGFTSSALEDGGLQSKLAESNLMGDVVEQYWTHIREQDSAYKK